MTEPMHYASNEGEAKMDEVANGQPDSSDPRPDPIVPTHRAISGFWRRLLALLIDSLVLGLTGMACGLFLFDQLASLGRWGRLMGFFVALAYFGVLNSAVGRGQTVGKRVMKIEVVDRIGRHISLGRSLLRYVILSAPFFLNGAPIPQIVVTSPIGPVIPFVLFALYGAIVYLYVFNRRTRQSLHDLVVGSFVTKTSPPGQVVGSIWRPHTVVVGILLLAIAVIFVSLTGSESDESAPELHRVQSAIQAAYQVRHAAVSVGWVKRIGGGPDAVRTYFRANVLWRHRPHDEEAAARLVASIILDESPQVMNKDFLTVRVSHGYDIGIARMHKSYTSTHRPSEWQEMAAGSASNGESTTQDPTLLNF